MYNILVVEDELKIAQTVMDYLRREGYAVLHAATIAEALKLVSSDIDLIVLDLMLPDGQGEDLCAHVVGLYNTPVIMLTSKRSEQSRINGFASGADDYLAKPFSPRELVARVKAVLKRCRPMENVIHLGKNIAIYMDKHTVSKNETEIKRPPMNTRCCSALPATAKPWSAATNWWNTSIRRMPWIVLWMCILRTYARSLKTTQKSRRLSKPFTARATAWGWSAMRKNKPFRRLFTAYFVVITGITVVVFIFFGLHIIDRFFSYYVDKVHEETQHMLVMQVAMHYKMYGSWNGYDGSETGAAAKLSGDYFTITDLAGNTVYTSEKGVERCCANPNHKYTRVRLPITVDGKTVGELTAGYFSNHISSPEADAFRGGGIWLVVLSIICISVVGAAISMLFFYRLSKPIRQIAVAAKDISTGHLQTRIAIKGNVAEMHEIADSINALGESLLNQEKFRQELIVSLSHELRTPLQILLSQLEAMLDGIYEADRERLEAMRAEVARTGELLNELEDRLIYENDAFDLNITQVNVSDLAHRVAIGHEGGFAQKKLDFIYNIEPDVIIEADSVRLAQVLINLLSNSIKYTQAGGASLSLKREGRNVVIEITDSGEGMDEETAKNIINRSSQAFKAVNSKGVGLYIAKLIVDKHGWRSTLRAIKAEEPRSE